MTAPSRIMGDVVSSDPGLGSCLFEGSMVGERWERCPRGKLTFQERRDEFGRKTIFSVEDEERLRHEATGQLLDRRPEPSGPGLEANRLGGEMKPCA